MSLPPLALKAIVAGVVTTPVVGLGIVYRNEIAGNLSGKTITKGDKFLKQAIEHTSNSLNFTLTEGANSTNLNTFPNFSTDTNSEASITFKVTANSFHSLSDSSEDTLKKKNKKSSETTGDGTD